MTRIREILTDQSGANRPIRVISGLSPARGSARHRLFLCFHRLFLCFHRLFLCFHRLFLCFHRLLLYLHRLLLCSHRLFLCSHRLFLYFHRLFLCSHRLFLYFHRLFLYFHRLFLWPPQSVAKARFYAMGIILLLISPTAGGGPDPHRRGNPLSIYNNRSSYQILYF